MPPKNKEQDFWKKVKLTDGCWEWQSTKIRCGYGYHRESNKYHLAHRFAFELWNGEIPEGMNVLHKCDNRACVNPDHLFLGTQQDNILDMIGKKRNGHPAGEKHWCSKLTEKDVNDIRTKYIPRKCSMMMLAKEYGTSKSSIRDILNGNSWIKAPRTSQ